MNEKRFRFDLFIALSALFISTVAAAASAYQTYVINQQYQASIWPYLGYSLSTSTQQISLVVRNYGLGPALIRSFAISHAGKPLRSFNDFLIPLEKKNENTQVDVVTIGQGSVLPASDSWTLLSVTGSGIVKRALASDPNSFNVKICYCSLLGRCWMRELQDPTDQPRDIRVCPLQGARPRMFGP